MFNLDQLTKEYLETLRARELYQIAREIKVTRYTRYKKQELVDAIMEMKNQQTAPPSSSKPTGTTKTKTTKPEKKKEEKKSVAQAPKKTKTKVTPERKHTEKSVPNPKPYSETPKTHRNNGHKEERKPDTQMFKKQFDKKKPHHNSEQKGNRNIAKGVLDIHTDGYGFLRSPKYIPDTGDIYVHPSLIKKLGLRPGDYIEGHLRGPRNEKEKYSALTTIDSINQAHPTSIINRPHFEDLIPIFPLERFRLSGSTETSNITNRLIELISPLGKGQRGLIVSPPKAGKTTVIKRIAQGIAKNNPEAYLMILLVDERPVWEKDKEA